MMSFDDLANNYEVVKPNLFVKLMDMQAMEEKLHDVPFTEVDGLAVTYNVMLDDSDGKMMSAVVTNAMLEQYGISVEQLHEDAIASSREMRPVRMESLSSVLGGMMGLDADEVPMMEDDGPSASLVMLSTRDSMHGAAAMLYPGQLDEAAKLLGGDFFVLPSSVHEVLLLPDHGDTPYQDLEAMVQCINREQVAPDERLSDSVYHYDAKDRVLEKAATFESRMQEKEMAKETEKSGIAEDKADYRTERSGDRADDKAAPKKSVLQRLNDKKEQVRSQKPKAQDKHRSNEHSI